MIIYKITNLINGKWYIGQDSKNNPNYFGSGILIKKALKKYGKNNFYKEILQILSNNSTREDLNKAEQWWIEKLNAVSDENSYNIANGGSDISSNPLVGAKISISMKGNKNGIGKRPHKSGKNWDGKRGAEHHLYGKPSFKKGVKVSEEERIKNAISHGAKPFLMFDIKSDHIIGEFLIIKDCAVKNGLCDSAISSCLKGKRKKHNGYRFTYKD